MIGTLEPSPRLFIGDQGSSCLKTPERRLLEHILNPGQGADRVGQAAPEIFQQQFSFWWIPKH